MESHYSFLEEVETSLSPKVSCDYLGMYITMIRFGIQVFPVILYILNVCFPNDVSFFSIFFISSILVTLLYTLS